MPSNRATLPDRWSPTTATAPTLLLDACARRSTTKRRPNDVLEAIDHYFDIMLRDHSFVVVTDRVHHVDPVVVAPYGRGRVSVPASSDSRSDRSPAVARSPRSTGSARPSPTATFLPSSRLPGSAFVAVVRGRREPDLTAPLTSRRLAGGTDRRVRPDRPDRLQARKRRILGANPTRRARHDPRRRRCARCHGVVGDRVETGRS